MRAAAVFTLAVFGWWTSGSQAADFQVWAPQALTVSVKSDRGRWPETQLAKNRNNAVWSVSVPQAQAGDRYQFVIKTPETTFFRPAPLAEQFSADGWSVLTDPAHFHWKSQKFVGAPLETAIVYELHVASFNTGTFASVIEKLDYLKELGVTYIELLPIQQTIHAPNWGYDVNLPNAIEASYGTPEEFQRLVDEAHLRGLGVLLDIVHNHYSRNSALTCFDGVCAGNSGSYFYKDQHGLTPWGPRPNFSEPEVRHMISENVRRYVQDFRVDGFRWDAVPYITQFIDFDPFQKTETYHGENIEAQHLIQSIVLQTQHANPHVLNIAEYFGATEQVTRPVDQNGLGFDTAWGSLFAVTKAITAPVIADINLLAVAANLNGSLRRVIFTESHDEVGHPPDSRRIPGRIDPANHFSWQAKKRSLLGVAVLLTSAGVPMLFQGQEFLEDQDFFYPAGTPLDWQKATVFEGILQAYKDLIRLRKNVENKTLALLGDDTEVFHSNEANKVLGYIRGGRNSSHPNVVLANFGGTAFGNYRLGVPHAGTWNCLFTSDDRRYSDDFSNGPEARNYLAEAIPYDGFAHSIVLGLPPFTLLLLGSPE